MGSNGCGKSTFLACLGNREVPIQDHIDIYYLDREIPASEKTALQAVMDADQERTKLEALAETLAVQTDDESQDFLMQVSSWIRVQNFLEMQMGDIINWVKNLNFKFDAPMVV